MAENAGASLQGRVAIVTGAARGIGAAIARRMHAAGAHLVLADLDAEPLHAVAAEVDGLALAGDLGREADVARLFEACDARHGRLDILVNNAAVGGARKPWLEMTAEDFDHTLSCNLRSAMLCTRMAAVRLTRPGGAIVNLTSRGVSPTRADYVASKFGLMGLTLATAQELGPEGIRVNAICPSTVNTEMMRNSLAVRAAQEGRDVNELAQQAYFSKMALGRFTEPDEIAAAAVFLASDAASAITAEELLVTGGRL